MLSSEDISFFCVVARSRSLAQAARKMNVTAPAVTQRLRALETRVGVRLLDRSLNGITLTDEGELVLAEGQTIIDAVENLTDQLSDRTNTVRGHLQIVAPYGFGRRHIAPIVDAFSREYHEATVTLHLSDTPTRMVNDNWDIIVHIGELNSPGRLMTTLAPNRRFLVASRDYLKGKPPLRHPHDLADHRCLALRENDEDVTLWRFATAGEEQATIRIAPAMSTNDGEILRDWTLAGLGLAVRSEWDVAAHLASGALVRVLPQWNLPETNIVAFLNTRHNRSKRTSKMLEMLRKGLKPTPWLQAE
ncbi:LysR family transcriptional regulator [Pseudooceanicola sp. 216_PA32_1]|uniref:LysR family transcriptional regulator n=1 Tax=Pseudooceanicola pacificus TaxID=2676438 RepID=A0A844W9R5_9RHOB|nr:LysR family transcriptional regulator [Pseudooceanicola pacificus]MWB77623.1 LysR family transcriptional regulator [Pseudooceanicola pacificus]